MTRQPTSNTQAGQPQALRGEEWRKAARAAARRKPAPRRKTSGKQSGSVSPAGVPGGVTVTASARCLGGCGWTTGPGTLAAVAKAAEGHRGRGHPAAVIAEPGNPSKEEEDHG